MSRLARAAESAGLVAWLDRVVLGKAKPLPSVLTEDGFVRVLLRETRSLQRTVGGDVRALMPRVRRSANINWPASTSAQRDRVVTELGNLVEGLPSEFAPGVEIVLDREGKRVIDETHRAWNQRANKRFPIDPTFALRNEPAVEALRTTTSMFFAPEYERQATRFRDRAQKTIADGLDQGLGRREIARELTREFARAGIHEHYWETVASVHVNRARSFSSAVTFRNAGVTQYEIAAVMDERTTQICRDLNGKVFSVSAALRGFDRLEAARDLAGVEAASPFLSEVAGDVVLPDGTAIDTLTERQLNTAGINMPPYHFRCRTIVVPVL